MVVNTNDIMDIVEFLDNMGDNQNDPLGKQCKKYAETLRELLALI